VGPADLPQSREVFRSAARTPAADHLFEARTLLEKPSKQCREAFSGPFFSSQRIVNGLLHGDISR